MLSDIEESCWNTCSSDNDAATSVFSSLSFDSSADCSVFVLIRVGKQF